MQLRVSTEISVAERTLLLLLIEPAHECKRLELDGHLHTHNTFQKHEALAPLLEVLNATAASDVTG